MILYLRNFLSPWKEVKHMLDVTGTYWLPGANRLDVAYDYMEERVSTKVFNFFTHMVTSLFLPLFFVFLWAIFDASTLTAVGIGLLFVGTIVCFAGVVTFDIRHTNRQAQEWTGLSLLPMYVLLSPEVRSDRKAMWNNRKQIEDFFAAYPLETIEWDVSGDWTRQHELQLREEVYAEARRIYTEVLGFSAEAFDERLEGIRAELPRLELRKIEDELAKQRTILAVHESGVASTSELMSRLEDARSAIAR